MGRKIENRYWENNVIRKIGYKKVYQIYCGTDEEVNCWLKNNPDIEVVNIKITGTRDEELVMVIYKIELEEA